MSLEQSGGWPRRWSGQTETHTFLPAGTSKFTYMLLKQYVGIVQASQQQAIAVLRFNQLSQSAFYTNATLYSPRNNEKLEACIDIDTHLRILPKGN